jgi:isoleucyl-tRNA synthetase
MPELERWVLHRLSELDGEVRRWCEDFDFHALFTAIYNFCTAELSAFYFDVRKDSLYCDRLTSPRRRAARTVLDALFSHLTAWLAPVLCFTAEEAWLSRAGGGAQSVHLRLFPEAPASWRDPALAEKWRTIRALRRVVTGALEIERRDKRIGSSLEAQVAVYAAERYATALAGVDLAEIAITSAARLSEDKPPAGAFRLAEVADVAVVVTSAAGTKCQRCWQVLAEVSKPPDSPELGEICQRCATAIADLSPATAE